MREVRRYRFSRCKLHFDPHICLCGRLEDPNGGYVLYADHILEVDRATSALREKLANETHLFDPHPKGEDCPTFYDGCHCTVETLINNIDRAEKAEQDLAEVKECLHELLKWIYPRDNARRTDSFIQEAMIGFILLDEQPPFEKLQEIKEDADRCIAEGRAKRSVKCPV